MLIKSESAAILCISCGGLGEICGGLGSVHLGKGGHGSFQSRAVSNSARICLPKIDGCRSHRLCVSDDVPRHGKAEGGERCYGHIENVAEKDVALAMQMPWVDQHPARPTPAHVQAALLSPANSSAPTA